MKIQAEVTSTKVMSYTNSGPRGKNGHAVEPHTVRITFKARDAAYSSTLRMQLPFASAKAYPVGRKVTITVEPEAKRR